MTIAGRTILVLEDEPVIALALEDLLLDGGAEPLSAGSLQAARELVASGGVDAAILDVNVNGEPSYPVARELAAAGIPFIFATGYGAAAHTAEFAGVPTVAKPYSLADIEAALMEAQ
jgi:DNA-binding response OmpR family regulator